MSLKNSSLLIARFITTFCLQSNRRIFSTTICTLSDAYNRMTTFTRSKGVMDGGSMKYYDRKVSAKVRQSSNGLVAG